MCTLIVAVRPDPERALVVAANRDEALDRPSEGPGPRRWGSVGVFAPRDLELGGTWMGLSENGLFVALTNRFGPPRHPDRRSRGEVVARALAHPDAEAAMRWARGLRPEEENAFHLVVADRRSAWLTVADGRRSFTERWSEGVHVATERAFGAAPSLRQDHLEARFRDPSPSDLTIAALERTLADHTGGPFDGVCVHMPERGYGTRSAAVLELYTEPSRAPTWRQAPGPPCTAAFETLEVRFG